MALCQYPARPEMYGLGIRIAFYVQWAGLALLDYLSTEDLQPIRLLAILLSSAATLGLVIQLAKEDLEPAEIYIVHLLAVGTYLFLVPIYIWRALTLCNSYWNPRRWSRERPAPVYKLLNFLLVAALAGIGIWFYTSYLPGLPDGSCSQYGFFFGRVSLRNTVYVAFNSILYILIAIVCVGILLMSAGWDIQVWAKVRRKRKTRSSHVFNMHLLRTFFNVAVLGTLIAAVEMAISYNELDATNNVDSLAQTIPLILSAGIVGRTIVKQFVPQPDDDSDGGSVSDRSHHHHHHHHKRRRSGTATTRTRVTKTTVVDEEGFPPPPPPVAMK